MCTFERSHAGTLHQILGAGSEGEEDALLHQTALSVNERRH
jgi:hypothetical protein